MTRKEYKGAAEGLTLQANISSSEATFQSVETPTSGWPTGASYPFVIVINRDEPDEEKKLISGRSGTTFTVQTHGYDGTSAVGHTSGASIEHSIDAASLTESSDHIYDTSRDDHTQYQKVSGRGAASGYASLDASALVPLALIPQLTAAQLAADSVGSSELAADAVGASELADNAVDTNAIVNLAVATGKIADDAVTFPKIVNLATDTLVGRDTAGTGDPEAISMDGSTLEFSGSATLRVKDGGITQAKHATGIRAVFVQDATPTGVEGDIWIDTTGATRVAKQYDGSSWLIMALSVPHTSQTRVTMGADRTWNSATPAAIPTNPCQVSFTKLRADTSLLCVVEIDRIFGFPGTGLTTLYARVNSVNNTALSFADVPNSPAVSLVGSVLVAGLAAGAWTVEIYGAVASGAVILASASQAGLTVTETL